MYLTRISFIFDIQALEELKGHKDASNQHAWEELKGQKDDPNWSDRKGIIVRTRRNNESKMDKQSTFL